MHLKNIKIYNQESLKLIKLIQIWNLKKYLIIKKRELIYALEEIIMLITMNFKIIQAEIQKIFLHKNLLD